MSNQMEGSKWYLGYLLPSSEDHDHVQRLLGVDVLPEDKGRHLVEVRFTPGRGYGVPGIVRRARLADGTLQTTGWHECATHFEALREVSVEEVCDRMERRKQLRIRRQDLTTLKALVVKYLPRVTTELIARYPELGD